MNFMMVIRENIHTDL